MEEQVGVILNRTTGGAMFVDTVGVPGSSVCSGKSSLNQPLGESFDQGWKTFGFPGTPKYVVGPGKYAFASLVEAVGWS